MRALRVALLVNPVAGVGGPAAQKGSDLPSAQASARAQGVEPPTRQRAARLFARLAALGVATDIRWYAVPGPLGGDALDAAGIGFSALTESVAAPTTAKHSQAAVRAALAAPVDLLVFLGGDGTARDVLDALAGAYLPVLGVPSGVKMHSGVFATSPERAAELLRALTRGGLVAARRAEVRDIDEAALRDGRTGSQRYGELNVPAAGGYLQHVKTGGREQEDLVLLEIGAELRDTLAPADGPLLFGPGSTCSAVKAAFGLPAPSLLGFDLLAGERWVQDVSARDLAAQPDHLRVVLSFIRGQGFLFGRGNQQLQPPLLRRLGAAESWLTVVGSRTKLASLDGRPLLVDSGAADVDEALEGLVPVVSGYDDRLWYRVARA